MGYQTTGLEDRRQKLLEDRAELQRLRTFHLGAQAFPKGEQRDRHRAIVYLTTLPTRQLLAIYRAAQAHLSSLKTEH